MNEKRLKVLLIEDNPGDARLIREYLADETNISLEWADSLSKGLKLLQNSEFDALLLDLSLPDSHGITTFEKVKEDFPEIPITVLTGLDDREFALDIVRKGAQDYLIKGQVTRNLLTRVIEYSIERKKVEKHLQNENQILETTLESMLERAEKAQIESSARPVEKRDEILCEQSSVHLLTLEQQDMVYKNLRDKFDGGHPVLAVIRMSPKRFKAAIERDIETVWLTTNHDKDIVCVVPNDIARLSMIITEFFKRAPTGCILFEGGEYIISNTKFPRFLNLVQFLNDKVANIDGSVGLVMDLETMDVKEARQIQRECIEPSK